MNNVSVNIQRDINKEIDYIVTKNALNIYSSLLTSYESGLRSFIIQGSYGTGKSSFIWALENQIVGKKSFFSNEGTFLNTVAGWNIVNIIGEPTSLIGSFGQEFLNDESAKPKVILKAIEELIKKPSGLKSKKAQKGLVIVVDEFGKHIEYFVRNNLVEEFYFLQQLAELLNTTDSDAMLIFTLHQDFLSYIPNNQVDLRNEWLKVSGRYKVLLFNEPVEQLLYFAKDSLSEINPIESLSAHALALDKIILDSKLTNTHDDGPFNESLFPLDRLSANILIQSLQKYGQNERSLFAFLDFEKRKGKLLASSFYTVVDVYDYLIENLNSTIQSIENTHRGQWSAIFKALDKCDVMFEKNAEDYQNVVKLIGLVNIFSKNGGSLDEGFINSYFSLTKNSSTELIVKRLVKNKIIRFFKHKGKFNFIDGTDIDLDNELTLAIKEIPANFDLTESLESLVSLPAKIAKRISFEQGTQRFFSFEFLKSIKDPLALQEGYDGMVYLLFEEVIAADVIKQVSKELKFPAIFVIYENSQVIRKELVEIKKHDFVIEKNSDDATALKLLKEERAYHELQVLNLVLNQMYASKDKNIYKNNWFVVGGSVASILSSLQLNRLMSDLVAKYYNRTPKFKNELMNREVLSTPVNTARRNLFRLLLSEAVLEEDLGFPKDKFPPEKAIYTTLLKDTGIHRFNNERGAYELGAPADQEIWKLWNFCYELLSKSTQNKIPIQRFYEELKGIDSGFGLKQGFLEFWVPLFLVCNSESFALYREPSEFVPYFNKEAFDVMHKNPKLFSIRFYADSPEKNQIALAYQNLIGSKAIKYNSNRSQISVYTDFLRIVSSQTNYAKRTKRIKPMAVRVRDAILNAADPESALFVEIPKALGVNVQSIKDPNRPDALSEVYLEHLREAMSQIEGAFSELLDDLERHLYLDFRLSASVTFEQNQIHIRELLGSNVNPNVLEKDLRLYYNRLMSPLEERTTWLVSVFDYIYGKSLKDLDDSEFDMVLKNLQEYNQRIFNHLDIVKVANVTDNSLLANYVKINLTNSGGLIHLEKVINLKTVPTKKVLELKELISKLGVEEKEWLFASSFMS
jgi:hypothetical protein